MFAKTLVVGIDGSETADRALDAALDVAADGATIHVVSAYDAPSTRRVAKLYSSVPEEFVTSIDLLAEDRQVVARAAKVVADRGFAVVEHLIDDDPASAILDTAESVDADLIVIGSRGLGRASQVVRGSVSTKIAHHSPVNFLVVH